MFRVIILGSDGLWDCLGPEEASEIAVHSRRQGKSAAEALVDRAIEKMPRVGVTDNVSAIVLFLNETENY